MAVNCMYMFLYLHFNVHVHVQRDKIMSFAILVACTCVYNINREILWQVWQPPLPIGTYGMPFDGKVDSKWWVDMPSSGWTNPSDIYRWQYPINPL